MNDRNAEDGRGGSSAGSRWLARFAALALGGIVLRTLRSKRRTLASRHRPGWEQAAPLDLDPQSVTHGHETHDVRPRSVAYVALGLATGAALAFSGAAILLRIYQLHTPAAAGMPALQPSSAPGALFPEPRLQDNPEADLLCLLAHEDSVLSSYGWVNRDSGIVRIPVEQAMSVLAARGMKIGGRIGGDVGSGKSAAPEEGRQPPRPDRGANATGAPDDRGRSGDTDHAGGR